VKRGLDLRIHAETVIPGREPGDKTDEVNFARGERTRNPEQCTVLDSGSAPKRAHPGMTKGTRVMSFVLLRGGSGRPKRLRI
jgi:hypothetical protein